VKHVEKQCDKHFRNSEVVRKRHFSSYEKSGDRKKAQEELVKKGNNKIFSGR